VTVNQKYRVVVQLEAHYDGAFDERTLALWVKNMLEGEYAQVFSVTATHIDEYAAPWEDTDDSNRP